MEPIQILSTVLITLGITLVIYLLKKSSESPFITKTNMKKSIRPSLIDQMLFYEKNPFAWRIGFAYSILGYNNNQIKEFNDALQKIVSVEKYLSRLQIQDFKKLLTGFVRAAQPYLK